MKIKLWENILTKSLKKPAGKRSIILGVIQFGIQIAFISLLQTQRSAQLICLSFASTLIWMFFSSLNKNTETDSATISDEAASNLNGSLKGNEGQLTTSSLLPAAPEHVDLPPEHSELTPSQAQVEPVPAELPPKVTNVIPMRRISQDIQWDTLMRNAQDGGANSVLACRILEKTVQLLQDGSKQVQLMVEAANAMKTNTAQLSGISKDIKRLSDQARIVSLNASIEASRAGIHGKVFSVVTTEMKNLSSSVAQMTTPINIRLASVTEKITENDQLCVAVSGLFDSMTRELHQFRNLMLRVEELATIQRQQLQNLEEKLKEN